MDKQSWGKMDWRIRFSHWRKQIWGLGTKNRQRLRVKHRRQVGCGNVHEEGRTIDLIVGCFYNFIIFLVFVFYLDEKELYKNATFPQCTNQSFI